MIDLLLTLAMTAAAPPAPMPVQTTEQIQAAPRLAGVVGICARWEADSLHVAEVVVVRPSGNPTLDAAVGPTVKTTAWPRVAGDTGGWTGRWISIGGVPIPPGPQPDCSALPVHVWPPA